MSSSAEADQVGSVSGIDPFAGPPRQPDRPVPPRHATERGVHGPPSRPGRAAAPPSFGAPRTRSGQARPAAPAYPVPVGLGRRAPSAMHVPMRALGEPPAGLGLPPTWPAHTATAPAHRPVLEPGAYPLVTEASWPARYRWVATLVGVVVLGALGIGTWALLGGGAVDGDYQRIGAHGLSYDVPRNWTSQGESDLPWVRTIHAEGVATGTRYSCGGQQHPRGSAGVLQVYRNDSRAARPQDAVRDLGISYAAVVYGPDAAARISDPVPLDLGGVTAATSLVTVRPSATSACRAAGLITVIALPSREVGPDGQPTVRVFMLQHDTGGGPKAPAILGARQVQRILSDITITGR